jgi:hypothetical protein
MPPSPGVSGAVQQTPKPYDGQATHSPLVGVKATVTLTGVPGRRWCCAALSVTLSNNASASGTAIAVTLLDGASGSPTPLWQTELGTTSAIGATDHVSLAGLAFFGTAGHDITLEHFAGVAGFFESVSFGAYLV